MLTNKQKQEINFLTKFYLDKEPTEQEKIDYINHTVHGIQSKDNPLFQAKRLLDINIKMWREDLTSGLLSVEELRQDFKCDYANDLINAIIKSVNKDYRTKVFKKIKPTILAFTNFI
jgi:hypothetical protein